jgi:hypothetical protein
MTQTVGVARGDVDRAVTVWAREGWAGAGARRSRAAVVLLAPDVPVGLPSAVRVRMVVCGRFCV